MIGIAEAAIPELIADEDERARREAENGVRQFNLALEIIREHVHDPERPFRLRSSIILRLHQAALEGVHSFAGTFRNTPVEISGSRHTPPPAYLVADEVEDLCRYVNANWSGSALHLAAYVLWRLNWIYPFADGNGRTARAVCYVVMSIRMQGILPGVPTIPDQIAMDKKPYYEALEHADDRSRAGMIDVGRLEDMLGAMLARQLLNATEAAAQTGGA